MALHLLKLAVGAESIADMQGWVSERVELARRLGLPEERTHTTRMVPKRQAELLDGGSLFWVIKGQIAVRQLLTDIRPFTDDDGIKRCHLVLKPVVVLVQMRPCRPFQGWRYLSAADAPPDSGLAAAQEAAMPEALRRELSALGLM